MVSLADPANCMYITLLGSQREEITDSGISKRFVIFVTDPLTRNIGASETQEDLHAQKIEIKVLRIWN